MINDNRGVFKCLGILNGVQLKEKKRKLTLKEQKYLQK